MAIGAVGPAVAGPGRRSPASPSAAPGTPPLAAGAGRKGQGGHPIAAPVAAAHPAAAMLAALIARMGGGPQPTARGSYVDLRI